MANALFKLSANFRNRIIKSAGLRLADAAGRDTATYFEIMTGTGAPSGAYHLGSGQAAVYFREDAADTAHLAYYTVDGGTIWATLADITSLSMVEGADPGDGIAIPITGSADIQMVSSAAGETGTLADPVETGLILHLRLTTDGGGDRVVTAASPINATGNNTLTFAAAGDSIVLMSARDAAAAYYWRLTSNDGVALTTV